MSEFNLSRGDTAITLSTEYDADGLSNKPVVLKIEAFGDTVRARLTPEEAIVIADALRYRAETLIRVRDEERHAKKGSAK